MILTVRFDARTWLIPVLIVIIVLSTLVTTLYRWHPQDRKDVVLEFKQGQSIASFTQELEHNEVLTNKTLFRFFLKLTGSDKHLRSGTYQFHQPSSYKEIIHTLTEGEIVLQTVVVPEGLTMVDIAKAVEAAEITSAEAFLEACNDTTLLGRYDIEASHAEGYLFPDTYRFAKGTDARLVVQSMMDHLFAKITPEIEQQVKSFGWTIHEWVTLASIIEKEAANPTEYTTIASVFHNRLKKNMRLESDPTIIYGLEDYDGNIRRKDIRKKHPYNTYVIFGLPPGPIASPGWGALMGTLTPADTEYLFFVANKERDHVFSKTYEEHKRNVYKYQIKR